MGFLLPAEELRFLPELAGAALRRLLEVFPAPLPLPPVLDGPRFFLPLALRLASCSLAISLALSETLTLAAFPEPGETEDFGC